MTDASRTSDARGEQLRDVGAHSEIAALRAFAVVAGTCWSVLFVVVGLRYGLQMYADGSLFSYSVAVQDGWAFHWHNISARTSVFLYSHLPAEAYVGLFQDPHGGIVLYGFLFFAAPLFGLVATYVADRSSGRVLFGYACFSTACLCPLVFGFPTEVWVSCALFWPALAVCHHARSSAASFALIFFVLLALVLTHSGALIFAVAILLTLAPYGIRDPMFLRAAGMFFLVMTVWSAVKEAFPPDAYMSEVLRRAAMHVFDLSIFTDPLVVLLFATLCAYAVAYIAIRRLSPATVHFAAALLVAAGLTAYWLWFDRALHAESRYYLRTALLVATPAFGVIAALHMLVSEGRAVMPLARWLRPLAAALDWAMSAAGARCVIGALALVTLIHAVETAKFVGGWTRYTEAVRRLSMGAASDPSLGDARFVSSARIGGDLNRLSWFSTTPYLSVLVAPDFAPARLMVDPGSNFFWISCPTATANLKAERAVPAESRRLIQREACLHRTR